ncbi:uncharacterized protein LOC110860850 isoform X3 [Folsomia candida]|uniref:uncharacterized protein LOC110860850 isoform X3 n=1 Tax=Folsomia candida TaxID=158441 RepID=UPI001604F3A5|nr:uncharacterized protein LOC110860850 isoform X3 [Folsomia candida]
MALVSNIKSCIVLILCVSKFISGTQINKEYTGFKYGGTFQRSGQRYSYHISTAPSAWLPAMTECNRTFHGDLVSVETSEEDHVKQCYRFEILKMILKFADNNLYYKLEMSFCNGSESNFPKRK